MSNRAVQNKDLRDLKSLKSTKPAKRRITMKSSIAQDNIAARVAALMDGYGRHGIRRSVPMTLNEDTAMAYIEAIGRHYTDRFVIDDDNRWAYLQMARWVVGDPAMEAITISDNRTEYTHGDLCKGIYLCGTTGSGKSLMMRVMLKFACLSPSTMYFGDTERRISWSFLSAAEAWERGCRGASPMTGEACAPIVCIQDLGSEPACEAVYMGVRREPLRQLIEARGDHDDMLTMATSNINIFGQDFEHRYGDRVASRLRGGCNVIFLGGRDRRR